MEKQRLRPADVVALYGVAYQTLSQWRVEKRGPSYEKVGRSIFYRSDDLERFFRRHLVRTKAA